MVRARIHTVGEVKVAPNGYSYTFQEDSEGRMVRVLTHHLIAKEKYGRGPGEWERVCFIDNDRTNLDPSNIEYRGAGRLALEGIRQGVLDKIEDLKKQIEAIDLELEKARKA